MCIRDRCNNLIQSRLRRRIRLEGLHRSRWNRFLALLCLCNILDKGDRVRPANEQARCDGLIGRNAWRPRQSHHDGRPIAPRNSQDHGSQICFYRPSVGQLRFQKRFESAAKRLFDSSEYSLPSIFIFWIRANPTGTGHSAYVESSSANPAK